MKKKLLSRVGAMLITMLMTIALLSENIVAFAATTKNTEYKLTDGWGYDFTDSGLPNAYDPITQDYTNTGFRNKWSDFWYYWKDSDGQYCYCVQLGTSHVDAAIMNKLELGNKQIREYYLDDEQIEYMKRATIYSYKGNCKYGYDWETELVASQCIIWAISAGYFDDSSTLCSTNEHKLLVSINAPTTADWNNMITCYKQMKADILSHKTIPSGTASVDYGKPLSNATYEMTYDRSVSRWKASITMDSNLASFTLPTIDGVVFSVSGSTLSVTATNAGMKNLLNTTIEMKKNKAKYASVIEECTPVFLSVQSGSSSQAKISYMDGQDPVPAYFRLTAPTGSAQLTKYFYDTSGNSVTVTSDMRSSTAFKLKHSYNNVTYYVLAAESSAGNYTFSSMTADENKATTFKLSSSNTINITGIPTGNYRWLETSAPDGYSTGEAPFKVTVNGQTIESEIADNQLGDTKSWIFVKSLYNVNGKLLTRYNVNQDYIDTLKNLQFCAYVFVNGTKKYIVAEPYNTTQWWDITDLVSKADSATIISPCTNPTYNAFSKVQISITPDNWAALGFDNVDNSRVYLEEISADYRLGYTITEDPSADLPIFSTSANTSITIPNHEHYFNVQLSKTSLSGNYVEGAEYTLFAAENIYSIFSDTALWKEDQAIETITTANGTVLFNTCLPITGKYYVKETAAPDGYVLNETIYEIEYDFEKYYGADKDTVMSEQYYDPYLVGQEIETVSSDDDTTKAQISKQDITTGNELPGATLQIIDENGNVVEEWVSTTEPHYIEGKLIAGKEYTLHETIAPDGYVISSDVTFTVSEDGSVDEVIMYDDTTKVEINKIDESGKPVEGAELELFDESGDLVDSWNTATYYIEGKLKAGMTYTLHETSAPNGYVLSGDVTFTVSLDGSLDTVEMIDKSTKVRFSKKSLTGDDEVVGATIRVYDSEGNVVDEWVSTSEPHYVEAKYIAGETYTMKEIVVPNGYVKAEDVEFTVSEDGSVDVVTMYDDITKVQISKQDITGDGELPGATIQIISSDGEIVDEWVSTTEPHYIEGKLIAGKTYTLRETIAPDGYTLANDIEFTVSEDGSVDHVIMYNSDATGTVQVQKRTEGMVNISGITLYLRGISESGKDINELAVTDENGLATWNNIPIGTYEVFEDTETVPTAYLVADPISVEVFYAQTTTAEIFNGEKTGTFEVHKTTPGMTDLEGIEFILSGTSDSGREISISEKTDKNGKIVFSNIPIGTYTIAEVGSSVPAGYLVAEPTTVEIYYAETTTAEIFNDTTKVEISKQDITTGKELPGATIQIISSDGEIVDEWVSTTEPHYIEGVLLPGETYTLHEEIAPEGYALANDIQFTVSEDGSVDVVTMYDDLVPIIEVPETPNVPEVPLTGASAAVGIPTIMLLGAFIIFSVRRKKED